MSARDRDKWTEKHATCEPSSIVEPDEWLAEALRLIEASPERLGPARRALDIACGLGHNAIWLAQQGWQVDAVDISTTGLAVARQSASTNDLHVCWIEADLDDWVPAANEYDLAVVFRFLDRETVPRVLRTALRPGGWLIYETFSSAQCTRPDNHISNPDFTLSPGELSTLFPEVTVVVQREDALHDRTVIRLLGRRRLDD